MGEQRINRAPARIAVYINRVATLVSLSMTVWFFFLQPEKSTVRLVLFLLWFAFMSYSTVRSVSELVSGQHLRERRFEEMLDRWQQEQGSIKKALAIFHAITATSVAARVAAPLLLLLV